MIGSKKTKAVEPKLSFADRLGKVKSMFVSAYNEAESLSKEILEDIEGEDRILRGFKIQFESRDGRYNCIDMDIDGEDNIRPVNINTLK